MLFYQPYPIAPGLYALSTGYGAFALRQFVGNEMYQQLLTDDPTNWPFHAWINLPLIPLSLIFGQTSMLRNTVPMYPIMFLWPTVPPLIERPSTVSTILPHVNLFKDSRPPAALPTLGDVLLSWPPSPLMAQLIIPTCRVLYKRYFKRFRHWLLGTQPAGRVAGGPRPNIRRLMFENWQMEMRVEGDLGAPLPPNGEARAAVEAAGALQQQNVDGILQAQPAAGAPPAQNRDGITIRMTGASLGRLIGGALLLPTISNIMGSLLFRLSKHSVLLRRILAVRPRGIIQVPSYSTLGWEKMSVTRLTMMALWLGVAIPGAGTPAWREADPVWYVTSINLFICRGIARPRMLRVLC